MKVFKAAFFVFVFVFTARQAYPQAPSKDEIQVMANQLLLTSTYKVSVKQVCQPVNGIQVAVLNFPYRECPTIIIIKKNSATNKWQRVFECLSPGIQDKRSELLDWHTKGLGLDFDTGSKVDYNFSDKVIKGMIDIGIKKGALIVPYQKFIHMSNFPAPLPKSYMPYTIDKTLYYDLANQLFDGRYKKYPTDQCIMYDTPGIVSCEFNTVSGIYQIKATTTNGQIWTYTFEGVDQQNRYLVNKNISVKKL